CTRDTMGSGFDYW
nr:immunoglobulin heavy chain junction region [Macaca mulatta]MOX92869.1 immunoglobulin heavy chain junction region [Macaca mulatta]MOX93329.1 immunoglobulin heavy chain junction region [Macaca mulatta]MOX93522.1 immunoglobulin heavy chain junction region [Macaca mulatta]MOX96839.1 immunoglobulin heavy chain junction region [Macaca mulatta]